MEFLSLRTTCKFSGERRNLEETHTDTWRTCESVIRAHDRNRHPGAERRKRYALRVYRKNALYIKYIDQFFGFVLLVNILSLADHKH